MLVLLSLQRLDLNLDLNHDHGLQLHELLPYLLFSSLFLATTSLDEAGAASLFSPTLCHSFLYSKPLVNKRPTFLNLPSCHLIGFQLLHTKMLR
jgi:hypothetical protein